MKFHQLTIDNFLTLSHAQVDLADRGLQLIQGVNDDDSSATSNGAGKSSMVDAICWCLYGVTARDVKGDAVVNLGAKKDCRVSLMMSNGASIYCVTRYRKHKTGKNTLSVEMMTEPATPIDLSKGTDTETQKVVEKLIGCSYEVFMAAVYSGQEVMPDLPKMKDRDLKTLIEEAAGLQRIERAYELARERMNTDKAAQAALQGRVDGFKVAVARVEGSLAEVTERVATWEAGRTVRVAETNGHITSVSHDMDVACKDRDMLTPGMLAAAAANAKIEVALADHKKIEANAAAAESTVRRAELAIDTGSLKRLAEEVKRNEDLIANAATEVKKPCTECGTVLETMTAEDYVAHRAGHLETAQNKLETAKIVARTKMAELLALRETAKLARAAVPDVTALSKEHSANRLVGDAWNKLADVYTRTANDYAALRDQLALRTTEPNPNASALTLCQKQLKEQSDSLAAALTTLDAVTKNFAISTAVVKVFGPAGVRAQILDAVTPYLNSRTADYLSALSDGEIQATWTTLTRAASGDLKEKFSIDVNHSKGGDSFAALSGGEKRKVRLSTALALQDLVASRATQPLNLWIGDEVDDALDPAGLERLMTILERRARERGTVIVISHSDLKDWCDNVTTVRKTGLWNSTVEGSLVCSSPA